MSTRSTTEPKPACAHSATPPDASSCPPPESILALCSGRTPSSDALPILLHLSHCPACQAALAFSAAAAAHLAPVAAAPHPASATVPAPSPEPPDAAEPAPGESLLQLILQKLSPLAAAVFSGLSTPAALSTGLTAGGPVFPGFGVLPGLGAVLSAAALAKFALHFQAKLPDTSPTYWTATLRFDPDDSSRLLLSLSLPARHAPPPDGTFVLCDLSIPVTDGHATIPFDDFRRSLSAGGVSFVPAGSPPIPGTLTLSS